MGCVWSIKHFVVNPAIEGQDESALEIFQLLGFSEKDIDLLYTAFWDIDADSSGSIRPAELFTYFEIEETPFNVQIFTLFDEDHSGLINFMEFVCTLWNLLTLPESDFGSLAYLIKDPSAGEKISFVDVREILEMMHTKKIDKDPNLNGVYHQLRKDLATKLSIQEFNRWTAANPSVTSPIMMLQLHIRRQIIGEQFWEKMSVRRKADKNQGRLNYVKDLQAFVINKNSAFRAKLKAEEEERQRILELSKGRHGNTQKNIKKKESVLLKHFNMKRFTMRQPQSLSRIVPHHDIADRDLRNDGTEELMNDIAKARKAQKIALEKRNLGSPVRQRRSFLKKPDLTPGVRHLAHKEGNKYSST